MSASRSLRRTVCAALHDEQSKLFFPINNAIALVIIAATVLVILETVPELFSRWHDFFIHAEYVILTVFGIEYALRVWSAPDRLKYITSFFGIIDLLSIVPGIFILFLPDAVTYHTLGVIRILRVLRLLRTFRLVRYVIPKHHRDRISAEIRKGQAFLNLEIYLFALATVVVFSGTLMYLAESHLPGSEFRSIPDGLWWAVVTVTTVGYGDLYPVTALGRLIGTVTMIAGLGLFVLMLTVVGRIMQLLLFGGTIEEGKGR